MPSSRFAWGKLYLALADLACIDDLLPQRVIAAYRHLAALNSTNLEPQSFQRLKTLREQFARVVSPSDEDDGTVTLAPLSSPEAAHIAHEIVGLYDEVASSINQEKAALSTEPL